MPSIKPIWIDSWIYKRIKRMITPHKSLNQIHNYWRHPCDDNLPQNYLRVEHEQKSEFLVKLMKKYTTPNSKILEIGCSVGRNLNYLFLSGFKNIDAVEINGNAVQLLRKVYPILQHTTIYNASIEEIIKTFKDGKFDVVFTMAVLEHIHIDSEWIFPEMVRITKEKLIIIEDEHQLSDRHFPRNYKKVFESIGMEQVAQFNRKEMGLNPTFYARVFTKESNHI